MIEFSPIFTLFMTLIKGVFIGIIASAPMGPVGVLCIQRTLNKGRVYGLVTGAGAALSDIIYALITGLGMSFVMDLITNRQNLFILQLVGSFLLFFFAYYMYRSDPSKAFRPTSKNKGTLVHNFVTSFLVTFSNPLIIFLFIALFARFAFGLPAEPLNQIVGYASIVLGAMLWWLGLTYVISKLRSNFKERGLRIFNRTLGAIVFLAALVGLIGTLTGLYSLH